MCTCAICAICNVNNRDVKWTCAFCAICAICSELNGGVKLCHMDVLFARFVRLVMYSIEMTYGRAICAVCDELSRYDMWTCYLRDLCNLQWVRIDVVWTCYLRDLCDL